MHTPIKKHPLGMVFGVFDGFHEGHRYFLREAKEYCEKLVVVVAHPNIVLTLKQRVPLRSLSERMQAVRDFDATLEVTSGDTAIGTWSALKRYQPSLVLLGYDQKHLGEELTKIGMVHQFIAAHHPEKYKSSLLNAKKIEV
ncbi:MAG: adenylyltransferase/cytidyltransferase family protein [Candidatus Moraniibacteriota bacterium]